MLARQSQLEGIVAGGEPITIAISSPFFRTMVEIGSGVARAVHVGLELRVRAAVTADAVVRQPHAPLREQHPDGEALLLRRLDVDQPAGGMRVERREQALVLPPDARGDGLGLPVDEDVDVRVVMHGQRLGGRGGQARGVDAFRDVVGVRPGAGPVSSVRFEPPEFDPPQAAASRVSAITMTEERRRILASLRVPRQASGHLAEERVLAAQEPLPKGRLLVSLESLVLSASLACDPVEVVLRKVGERAAPPSLERSCRLRSGYSGVVPSSPLTPPTIGRACSSR